MKTILLRPTNESHQTIISVREDTQFVLDLQGLAVSNPSLSNERTTLIFNFETQGVQAEIMGIFNLSATSGLNFETVAHHKVPNTSCLTDIRGALQDSSRSSYVGKIIIDPAAQQTSSFLNENVLTVGLGCSNRSEPILEIEADDVKASHGSTTGNIDYDQEFYLLSRGFTKSESQQLILEGFFQRILNKIMDPKVREDIEKSLW